MSKRNKNRPGYKKTKVGWIPEEWECHSGNQITSAIAKGSSPRWQGYEYTSSGMLFITSENVRDGYIDVNSPKYLPLEFHKKLRRTQIRKGDILVNLVGASIGRSCLVGLDLSPANVNQAVSVFRVKDNICREYVASYLQAPGTVRRILGMQVDAARPNISLTDLRNFLIPLPPFPEQRKIAEILSAWDDAIEQTRKLIDAKKGRKKALMQQLLTGKKRLSKFQNSWSMHKIGDLASILFSNVDKKTFSNEIPVRLCNYTDVYYNNRLTRDIPLMEATATNSEIQKYKLEKDDVIITKDSETAEDIAVPCYVADQVDDVICGYHLAIIRPKPRKAHGPFLSQLIMTDYPHYQFVRIANGVTRFGLPLRSIKQIEIKIPPVEEQRYISKVLSTADDEIKALKKKYATLEKQKRGLMQKLLTGEVRVSV